MVGNVGNYDFDKDLKNEQKNKNLVSKFLTSNNFKIINDNNDNKYDLLVNHSGDTTSIELKEDFEAARTGNVAIEYYSRGKPSGIRTTQADIYWYTVHYNGFYKYLAISVNKLKEFFKTSYDYYSVVGGDKNSYTKMYLMKVKLFESICNEMYKSLD